MAKLSKALKSRALEIAWALAISEVTVSAVAIVSSSMGGVEKRRLVGCSLKVDENVETKPRHVGTRSSMKTKSRSKRMEEDPKPNVVMLGSDECVANLKNVLASLTALQKCDCNGMDENGL